MIDFAGKQSTQNIQFVHHMNIKTPPVKGTQAVDRALGILSLLSRSHESGLGLADIVNETGLERITAYRLLQALVHKGYVARGEGKRYHLGVASMHIGLAAMSRAPLISTIRPAMSAIARITGDATFLVVRNGDFAHAIHQERGEYPLQISPTGLLGFLLLGLGTAGQALLATLEDQEIEALFQRHQKTYLAKDFSMRRLLNSAKETRSRGYSVTESTVTAGVVGVGIAFPTSPGMYVSLSVAAAANRIPPARRARIAAVLQEQAGSIDLQRHPQA